jgi:hypothetical protein
MKHHFAHTCYDIDALFVVPKKHEGTAMHLKWFMANLERQSKEQPDMFEPNDYVGDGFEAFVESLLLQLGTHQCLQMKDYHPGNPGEDMGVDGYGYGKDGEVHTVQAKYRSNTMDLLTANKDHISNFVAHSLAHYNAKHMTLITTADGLHNVISESMYAGQVRTIGYQQLCQLVDANGMFWQDFRDMLKLAKSL